VLFSLAVHAVRSGQAAPAPAQGSRLRMLAD
jgi:hypothetical protein